jgi:hypothetical protein
MQREPSEGGFHCPATWEDLEAFDVGAGGTTSTSMPWVTPCATTVGQ